MLAHGRTAPPATRAPAEPWTPPKRHTLPATVILRPPPMPHTRADPQWHRVYTPHPTLAQSPAQHHVNNRRLLSLRHPDAGSARPRGVGMGGLMQRLVRDSERRPDVVDLGARGPKFGRYIRHIHQCCTSVSAPPHPSMLHNLQFQIYPPLADRRARPNKGNQHEAVASSVAHTTPRVDAVCVPLVPDI